MVSTGNNSDDLTDLLPFGQVIKRVEVHRSLKETHDAHRTFSMNQATISQDQTDQLTSRLSFRLED